VPSTRQVAARRRRRANLGADAAEREPMGKLHAAAKLDPRAVASAGMSSVGGSGPRGLVQSVERAIALLEAVSDAPPEGETVAALAAACGLNRATAWRLLATLEAYDLVYVDPATHRYSIGLAISRLSAAGGVVGLTRRTHGVLVRLSERTQETADLAVAHRLSLTYVAEVAPPSVLSANWLGRHVPLHATSSGKALLAWLPEVELLPLLEHELTAYTKSTITSRQDLRAELAKTRARGYGVCAGELEETLYGVSAPVLDPRGRPFAIVSVWGPQSRVPVSRFPALGLLAQETAAEIGKSLRWPHAGASSSTS
jgi:DNA-binding IclR family transcriptional regulator